MDREKKLQKAKEIVHFDGYKTACYSLLYMALRDIFEFNFKDSVKIVLKETKENRIFSIDYKEAFTSILEMGEEVDNMMSSKMLQKMEKIEHLLFFMERVEKKIKPKSVLMNLIWLEATKTIDGNVDSFLNNVNKLKNKLIKISRG